MVVLTQQDEGTLEYKVGLIFRDVIHISTYNYQGLKLSEEIRYNPMRLRIESLYEESENND